MQRKPQRTPSHDVAKHARKNEDVLALVKVPPTFYSTIEPYVVRDEAAFYVKKEAR